MAHEKMVRDGMVAVLYSPGFGAGWSSWAEQWMATDKRLVECVEAGGDVSALAEKIALEEYGEEYVCVLGGKNLRIDWLPEGTPFRIDEYDGSESVQTASSLDMVA